VATPMTANDKSAQPACLFFVFMHTAYHRAPSLAEDVFFDGVFFNGVFFNGVFF
jgi:hypothetical protein